ncbi:MAG: Mur ligase domain-containing protein [Puniceicoccales bacterium]|jgi:UDP-N-acetylmuramate: L-alanyl-gamma-D-glutamyl-meso-diaminopimelate ligase|nr:Mur ligase domain-containing protein [Puniceicoccales bacterium]
MLFARKRVYFLAIGGVAMGNGAIMAKAAGYAVGGSDRAIYGPMDGLLRDSGITFFDGYGAENIIRFGPDLVVVGNGVGRGNPEVEWLLDSEKIPFTSLPQFLFEHFLRDRHRIVISGTHGKTTTAALCAYYLRQNGIRAGYFIGGAPLDFPCGADRGDGRAPFVLEGDEYDSAFFDKRSKFIHYRPNTLAIGTVEFDHADIFRDLADVERTFDHLLRTIPRSGQIFYNGNCDSCRRLLAKFPWAKAHSVGLGRDSDFQIRNVATGESGTSWEIVSKSGATAVRSSLIGEFNARNGTMALLAAHDALGSDLPEAVDLGGFSGVRRRQRLLRRDGRCAVYEDFGHHPGAIREVLRAMRSLYPDCELIACFEPASLTAMGRTLEEEFADALSLADRCLLGALCRPEAVPEGERLRPEEMAGRLRGKLREAAAFADNRELLGRLRELLSEDSEKFRVAVLFSNGPFEGVLSHWKECADGGTS